MPQSSRTRRHPAARYVLLLGVLALAGAVAGAVGAVFGATTPVGLIVTAVAAAAAMAFGIWACAGWWRALDEAAREAHKWAWWWGSTGGLAVGGVGLITLMASDRTGDAAVLSGHAAADLFFCGAMACVLAQAIGYGVAWSWWWLSRR